MIVPFGKCHRKSTMVQVMACCQMAPIHYLNQCCQRDPNLMITLRADSHLRFTGHQQAKRWQQSLTYLLWRFSTFRWRHNGCDSVSNHQPHHCLLNRLFRRRSKKTPKLRVTGLCVGNSPGIHRTNGQYRGKCFHLVTRHHELSVILFNIYILDNVIKNS